MFTKLSRFYKLLIIAVKKTMCSSNSSKSHGSVKNELEKSQSMRLKLNSIFLRKPFWSLRSRAITVISRLCDDAATRLRFFCTLYEMSVTVKERRVKRSFTGHDWIIADSPPLRCSISPSTTAFRNGTYMSM